MPCGIRTEKRKGYSRACQGDRHDGEYERADCAYSTSEKSQKQYCWQQVVDSPHKNELAQGSFGLFTRMIVPSRRKMAM